MKIKYNIKNFYFNFHNKKKFLSLYTHNHIHVIPGNFILLNEYNLIL